MKLFRLICFTAFLALLFVSACTNPVPEPEPDPQPVLPTDIQVIPGDIAIKEGESALLTATVLPEDAEYDTIVWYSNDPSIARVEDGLVRAVKSGETLITAMVGKLYAHARVVVTTDVIPVTSIDIDKYSIYLHVGESEVITATIQPDNATNKALRWSSSDTAVATVDQDGKVTAVSVGNAFVGVSPVQGNCSTNCAVFVVPTSIAVTGVTLDQTELTLSVGESFTLTASVIPEDATEKHVYWESSDTGIVWVSNGTVHAASKGSATVTAITYDGAFTASCQVDVTMDDNPVTGICVNNPQVSLLPGQTCQIEYDILPGNASNQEVLFESSNRSVARVDDKGLITAVSLGQACIRATTVDGGFYADCLVTVKEGADYLEEDGVYYKASGNHLTVVAHPSAKYSGNIILGDTLIYEDIVYYITAIDDDAFSECPDLLFVSMSNGLSEIGARAFVGCTNLSKLFLSASVQKLDDLDPLFERCPKLEIIVLDGEDSRFFVEDHALYERSNNGNILRWMPEKQTGIFNIQDGTTQIGRYAFFHTNIDKVVIPRSVRLIQPPFFYGTSHDGEWFCKTPLEIELNWETAEEVNAITTLEWNPSMFYFTYMDRSQITVTVPKGTKALYESHWLWSTCGAIVERLE